MAPSAALPIPVLEALARGTTVLTANQRAARTLRHAFDRHNRALGLAGWHPPAILAWDTWTGGLWHRLLLDGRATSLLLNRAQEHTLWRSVIDADASADGVVANADALTETAASAWSLLHAYRGRPRLAAMADTADTRAFARWAAAFERLCREPDYLTQAQLCESLRAAFVAGFLTAPDLLLLGFDAKTPAQITLLDAVSSAGAAVTEPIAETLARGLRPNHGGEAAMDGAPGILGSGRWVGRVQPASDDYTELTTAAWFLRDHLTDHPESRIAVVLPSLETERAEIDRAFRRILAPELEDIAAPTDAGPFEFSLGVLLARTPIVATALDLLDWATSPLPLERVGALLLSPHFAACDRDELLARAEFDAFHLRRRHLLRPEVTVSELYSLAAGWRHTARIPTLTRCLRALQSVSRRIDLTLTRTHSEWISTIAEVLEAADWAHASRLNSFEFQTRRKWETVLDELATLDFDNARISFQSALDALQRIATQTLFAPESRDAPIQIMGPLESAGSSFDAIWFLRANDLAWPSPPATNPLLPWSLQRDLAMPGANPAHDAALARRITARIAASAPTVVFSYAQQSADSHQRPSPALAGLALEVAGTAPDLHPPEPAVSLEVIPDDAPITPLPDGVLRGGASILQAQAACAFRAFAEKRLFSAALDGRELGLDPSERGNLVHTVLERFWAQVETQAALKLLATTERDALLSRAIDDALASHNAAAIHGWDHAYLDTERQRLLKLLRPWLDFELTRAHFAVKSREEMLDDVAIGPLRLNIRVDRVDLAYADSGTAEPSGEIILDYKTGPAKPADWLGERPDAPQLPLYAVVSQSQLAESAPLAGVAFANVRAGSVGLSGYAAHGGVLPKASRLKTDSLESQIDEWRVVLTALAEDFHAGDARVAPKQYPTTCRYCDQRMLCRLNPATLEADSLEDFIEDTDPEATPEADRG
jgi:ATP-dependent helicase/nuclease subunit B